MTNEQVERIVNRERKARKEAERLLEVKSTELYDINQNLEQIISERTEKLSMALEEAKIAIQTKDDFLSNMSHEIRTPLNAIIGFIEMMQQNPNETDNFIKYLKIIDSSSKNLLKIINDILDFSKLQNQKYSLSLIHVDLKEKLSYAFEVFSENANKKSLKYELIFSEKFPSCLTVDDTKIIQIVSNFISNAIKFTPIGKSVTVHIDYDDTEKKLKIEVIDKGIGIESAAKEKIFNSFEQEDASITREFAGTGLGLSIASQLIGLMNGQLIFKSVKEEGSTFGFVIRTKICKHIDTTSKEILTSLPSYTGKVLIAEDNEMNIMLMEVLMEKFSIDFDIVTNGELAVEAIKKTSYNLVLMDNQMPKMSGKEATRIIRTFNKDIPIVALSANVTKNDRIEFLSVGMNDTLMKPINFNKLKEQFEKYL